MVFKLFFVLFVRSLFSFIDLFSLTVQQESAVASRSFAAKSMEFSAMSNDAVGGAAPSGGPEGQIRTEFPETWMWRSGIAG